MNKNTLIILTLLMFASSAFCADFAPTVLKITAPANITSHNPVDGVTVPVTISGRDAAVWLVINTKDQGANIKNVRNGFLGWHYVNKIDTTVYVSQRMNLSQGTSEIKWDGRNLDGNTVAPMSYSYFLWGYDYKTPRVNAAQFIQIGWDWEGQMVQVYEKGTDGLPLANPMLAGAKAWWWCDDNVTYMRHGTQFKWILGSDPMDASLMQTTFCPIYKNKSYATTMSYGGPLFDPNDYNIFYQCAQKIKEKKDTMFKWTFVSGGDAVLDPTWLGWDNLTWEDNGVGAAEWSQKPSCYTDGNYIYIHSPGLHVLDLEWNRLRCVSFDGNVVMDKPMHEWYMPNDKDPQAYVNGAFHHIFSRNPNELFLLSYSSCLMQMINTSRLVNDPNDETDMVMFSNSNGDYFMDSGYSSSLIPTGYSPWFCLANRTTGEFNDIRRDSIAIDSNGFSVIGCSFYGMNSFGVMTQDGTAIGYMAFADDKFSNQAINGGGQLCDNGSAYDGLYFAGPFATTQDRWENTCQTYFTAFDSFGGKIEFLTDSVKENAPSEFKVSQNSPNPFNPSTSVSFTIPREGKVKAEVFNISGQKVATLLNGEVTSGRHSIVWNASGVSAGTYFCMINYGNVNRTVKMTLVK